MSNYNEYIGGGTLISLTLEGTAWPSDPTIPDIKVSNRWSDDGYLQETDEQKSTSLIKQARYRLLAKLAEAYRMKQKKVKIRLPRKLYNDIMLAGGPMQWVNNDEKALETFWHMVAEQESGKWNVAHNFSRKKR